MLKDAYYFSHDSNAKDDPKCVMLIEQLGLEGYGIFWVLIETLREQPTYKYPMALLPALARRFNTTADKMKAVVCGYGLFVVDDNEFFSLSLMERMKKLDAKREQAREAINKRWEKQKALPSPTPNSYVSNTDVLRENYDPNTSKVKESKVNESKKIYMDVVELTDGEYQKLVERFGEYDTKDKIENLALYIKSKEAKYKCHYSTILSWDRKNAKEQAVATKPKYKPLPNMDNYDPFNL